MADSISGPLPIFNASPDPLAHVKIGDVDPTRHNTGPICGAITRPWGFVCTRVEGHAGQHIAGAGWTVAAVWPAAPKAGA